MTRPPAPPAADLAALLPPDIDLSDGRGLRTDAPAADVEQVWYGMIWGRLGRGDLAWAWWDRLSAPSLQPWLAAERGRLLRELGGHLAAQRLERAALPRATDPLDHAMLTVSLAADAIGRSDAELARRHLASARRALTAQPWSPRRDRQGLRVGWVAVELSLLTGERAPVGVLPSWDPRRDASGSRTAPPTPAHEHPRRASRSTRRTRSTRPMRARSGAEGLLLPSAYRSASRFHVAKGCLFAGVVSSDPELLALAADLAPPALLWGVHLARASLGLEGAAEAAATARARVVPPPALG